MNKCYFFRNWVIGFIRKYRPLVIIWHQKHDSIYQISGDMTFCEPYQSIFLQNFNVRKWWLKFFIDINAETSWECIIIWCTQSYSFHGLQKHQNLKFDLLWQYFCHWNFKDLYLKMAPCDLFRVLREQVTFT